jgi:hypothetical protein
VLSNHSDQEIPHIDVDKRFFSRTGSRILAANASESDFFSMLACIFLENFAGTTSNPRSAYQEA